MPRSRVSSEDEGDSEPEIIPHPRSKPRPMVRDEKTPKTPLKLAMKALNIAEKAKIKIPAKTTDAKDIPIGFVYLKAGRIQVFETPSRKYYTVRTNGTRNYLTARVESGKLSVYDEK